MSTKPLSLSPADEGTVAHKLLEMCVRKGLCSPLVFVGKTITVPGEDKQHSVLSPSGAGRFLKCMGSIPEETKKRENKDITAVVTKEMANAVEVAVDYIRAIRDKMEKPTLLPEHEVWIPSLDFRGQKGHGTIDIVLYDDYELHVMDYKHGRGIAVEVDENDQTKLYTVGIPYKERIGKRIWNHILQPRSPHPDGPCRPIELNPKELAKYDFEVNKQIKTYHPKTAKYCAGDHCKYCPKTPCPAFAEAALEVAKTTFKDFIEEEAEPAKPGKMATKDLAATMSKINLLRLFISSVEAEVFGRLQKNDKAIQSFFKLVEGKSNRTWRSESTTINAFKKLGISADLYAPRKLVGIGDGEDLMPKEKREKLMAKLTYKPPGKTVIATVDDPRKPIRPNSAEEDFAAYIDPKE